MAVAVITDLAQIQRAAVAKEDENGAFRTFVKLELELSDRRLNTIVSETTTEVWEYRKFKRPFPPAACAHPLLPLVPALGSSSHAPGRAHCQGAPVLPAPPGTPSRHRSARGWPAYRQQAAASRLLAGDFIAGRTYGAVKG